MTVDHEYRTEVRETMLRSIGSGTLNAISGGRSLWLDDFTAKLPVGHGYSVEVEYREGRDTYTVRRVFERGGVKFPKGEVTDVYAAEVSDVAYNASCYVNGPFGS